METLQLKFGQEDFITQVSSLSTWGDRTVIAALSRSLTKELAPFKRLRKTMIILAAAGLVDLLAWWNSAGENRGETSQRARGGCAQDRGG